MAENTFTPPVIESIAAPEQPKDTQELTRRTAAIKVISESVKLNATFTEGKKPEEGTPEDMLNDVAGIIKYEGGKDEKGRAKVMTVDGSRLSDPKTHEKPPYPRPKVRIRKITNAEGAASFKVTACADNDKPEDTDEVIREVWFLFDKQLINGREYVAANLAMAYDMEGKPVPHPPVWIPTEEMCVAKALSQRDKVAKPITEGQEMVQAALDHLADPNNHKPLENNQLEEAMAELPIMHGSDLHFGRARLAEIKQDIEDNETANIKAQLQKEVEDSESYKQAVANNDEAEKTRLMQEGTAPTIVAQEINKRVNEARSQDASLNELIDLEVKMKDEKFIAPEDLARYCELVCQTRFNVNDLKKQYGEIYAKLSKDQPPILKEELQNELATVQAKLETAKKLQELSKDNAGLTRLCVKVQNGELTPQDLESMQNFARTGNVNNLGELVHKYGALPEDVKEAVDKADEKTKGFLENNKWMYALIAIFGIGAIAVVPAIMQGMNPRR